MSENDKLGKLAEISQLRKERLRQLKLRASRIDDETGTDIETTLPKPIFRSYKPQNEETVGEIIPQIPSGDIEEAVVDQLDLLKQIMVIDDIDIGNLAPRKPDWDLKRDVAKKLERLDRRTQKAIAELIRDRLKKNQEGPDILQAVNVATAHTSEMKTSE